MTGGKAAAGGDADHTHSGQPGKANQTKSLLFSSLPRASEHVRGLRAQRDGINLSIAQQEEILRQVSTLPLPCEPVPFAGLTLTQMSSFPLA